MQEKVNATIIYFSPCNSTRARALEIERQLQKTATVAVVDITKTTDHPVSFVGEMLVVVLPIYNNSLPLPAKEWLQNSELDFRFALICLTYGGVSRGRAMDECAQILNGKNIALASGGFLPTNHCYINKDGDDCNAKDIAVIKTLVDKALSNGALIVKTFIENTLIDKTFADTNLVDKTLVENTPSVNNILNINSKTTPTFAIKNSNSAPSKRLDKYRDALFPKPYTDKKYCISCNKCIEACPVGVINLSFLTSEKCIHCNACVNVCETNARIFKISKTAKFGIKFARLFNKKYIVL